MVWKSIVQFFIRCFITCTWGWSLFTTSLTSMEEIVSKFSGKFAITEEEQEVIVVDKHEVGSLKSSRVFLVGKV